MKIPWTLTLISIDFFKPKQKFVLVPWSPLCVRKHRWFLGQKIIPLGFTCMCPYSNCFWVEVNDASPIRVEEEEGRNGVIIVKVHQRVIWHASRATSSLKRDFFFRCCKESLPLFFLLQLLWSPRGNITFYGCFADWSLLRVWTSLAKLDALRATRIESINPRHYKWVKNKNEIDLIWT